MPAAVIHDPNGLVHAIIVYDDPAYDVASNHPVPPGHVLIDTKRGFRSSEELFSHIETLTGRPARADRPHPLQGRGPD